jgi:hypothetical protein
MLVSAVLLSALAFAGDGFRPAGAQVYETKPVEGPADTDLTLDAVPPGIETVTIRLRLTLDETSSIVHPPFPPGSGMGTFVWLGRSSVSISFPGTGLPVVDADADSGIGVGWPLEEGGGIWNAITPGLDVEVSGVPAWSEELLCKVRFELALTGMSTNVTPCEMYVSPLQIATVTIIPEGVPQP